MNTLIYMWIDPMIVSHQKNEKRIFFNVIVEGEYASLDKDDLDSLIEGNILRRVMDFADIDTNWDFGCISAELTKAKTDIEITDSPKERKNKKEIAKIVSGKKDFILDTKTVLANEDGTVSVSLPAVQFNDTIDFPKIWESLEHNFIDKIKEGDMVTLTDDDGNKIFEITGGSFLNIGHSNIIVKEKNGLLKGGLYIRDDGSLDIGDAKRTLFLKIHTKNLLKASFKLQKSLTDIAQIKLLSAPYKQEK